MRNRLQQATLELILNKGLKFTIADLATHLRTSKRTIYEHFESKEQIISSIVDEAIEEVLERQRRIYQDDNLTLVEKWKAIMSITPSNLKSARLLDEMKRYAPEEWKKIDRLLQEEWDVVTAIIEAAIENGEMRPVHVPSVIQMMRAASVAIFDPSFLMNTTISMSEAIDTIVDVFLSGLAADTTKLNT